MLIMDSESRLEKVAARIWKRILAQVVGDFSKFSESFCWTSEEQKQSEKLRISYGHHTLYAVAPASHSPDNTSLLQLADGFE